MSEDESFDDGDDEESNPIDMIDTFDRPGKAYAENTYAGAGTFGGKRIPKAGPALADTVVGKLGLGVDTGVSIGLSGVEAKFLGTGFSIGPKTSVSFLGSEASCTVM